MIGLLEQDIGADAGLLELSVVFHGRRRDVDVDAADRAVLVLDAVDRLDAVENVLDRVVDRVLAGLDREALVAHVLQGDDLLRDLLLRQLAARDMAVLAVVRTVYAAVHAVVREVERREHDDAVAVKPALDLAGQRVDLLDDLGNLAGEQDGGLPVGKALTFFGLVENFADQRPVVAVFVGVPQGRLDFFVGDELLGFHGFRIVHDRFVPFFRGSRSFPVSFLSDRRQRDGASSVLSLVKFEYAVLMLTPAIRPSLPAIALMASCGASTATLMMWMFRCR